MSRKLNAKKNNHFDLQSFRELALVPLRDTVIYPHMVNPLSIGRDRSIRALEAAVAENVPVAIFLQRDPELADPGIDDLHAIGTEAIVGRTLRMPDGTTSVIAQGNARVKLIEIIQTEPFLR